MAKGLSPMMTHYLQIKEKYSDCIVFYRLGDFYEMFFDDAVKASELLELTLTGRDCGLDERAPMCGVPFHAADEYIAKLVGFGEKVAICEQLSEAQKGNKDLVIRDVTKIITAGTLTNSDLIDEKNNNFLASVYISDNKGAISWADITTGDFYAKNFYEGDVLSAIFNELVKINPVEIIGNSVAQQILNSSPLVTTNILPKVRYLADSEFEYVISKNVIEKQLGVANLKPLGINDNDLLISSSGALISYFKDTQKSLLANVNSIKVESNAEYMMLDYTAVRNLELVRTLRDNKKYGTLLWVLDKTITGMGSRTLQNWILSPLNNVNAINYRLDAVENLFKDNLTRTTLRETLKNVKDVKRLTGKISNGNLLPKDCISLMKSLENMPNIKFSLSGLSSKFLCDISNDLFLFDDVIAFIKKAVYDESEEKYTQSKKSTLKLIKDGYNAELDELRKLSSSGKNVVSEIEAKEREKTGIKTLKIGYNRVFGYYIEVTNSFKDRIPYEYIRRQTLTNCERYVTEELKEIEDKILSAEEKSIQLENKLYSEVKNFLLGYIKNLQITSDALANLDVLLSFATVAKENDYVKPIFDDNADKINVISGRHPVVEKVSKQHFIPNDCFLDGNENRAMIITGPNMAGKSTYMRQIALISIMGHIGSFVPAKEAHLCLVDKVFTRIGASDSLIFNQSTFMVEMSEMASIINNATPKSLLILDEIGRGTSTYDGLSIAWAIMEYLVNNVKAKTLFATHYHELTELENIFDGVKNYKVTVKEMQGSIIFLRKIMRGSANKSFGIEVAELAGIDKNITQRAKSVLKQLEKSNLTYGTAKNVSSNDIMPQISETEKIIKELDINNLSPMQAFTVLCDLYEKANKENE